MNTENQAPRFDYSELIPQHSVLYFALIAMLFAVSVPANAQQPVDIPRRGVLVTGRRGLEVIRQSLRAPAAGVRLFFDCDIFEPRWIDHGLSKLYHCYQESRGPLARLRKETAPGAALRIDPFLEEIHHTLEGIFKSCDTAPEGVMSGPRFEFLRPLLIAPAIFLQANLVGG